MIFNGILNTAHMIKRFRPGSTKCSGAVFSWLHRPFVWSRFCFNRSFRIFCCFTWFKTLHDFCSVGQPFIINMNVYLPWLGMLRKPWRFARDPLASLSLSKWLGFAGIQGTNLPVTAKNQWPWCIVAIPKSWPVMIFNETGKPHDLHGKIHGFRWRFSLKPIRWDLYYIPSYTRNPVFWNR